MTIVNPFTRRRITRKQFLQASGGAMAAGGWLSTLGSHATLARQSGEITIPDSGAALPEEDVTARVITNPEAAPYWNAFADAYSAQHDNIAVEVDALNVVEIRDTVSLGLRNESVHDVFYYNQQVSVPQAVSEGWLAPLNDVIPNYEEWFAAFPQGTFLEGVHIIDGKQYLFTAAAAKRSHNLLLFNRQALEDAGYDPAAAQLSIDEYRDAARKVTDQGGGRLYGMILEAQPNRLVEWVTDIAHRAGAIAVGGIAPDTGEYVYTADAYVAAIEAMLALKSDGSMFPENPPAAQQAWARVPAGNAAMVTAGAWVVDTWERDAPDFAFGVGVHPVLDKDNALPQSYPPDRLVEPYSIYAGSEIPAVAGDILWFLGSDDGQKAWGEITGGLGLPPVLPDALAHVREQASEQGKNTIDITDRLVATPTPIVRNPAVAIVHEEMQALSPNLGEVIQAILVGETTDIPAALQDLKDRSEAELDRAIAAAQERGAEVTRDDWVFPNWDPTRDYTPDDYDAL